MKAGAPLGQWLAGLRRVGLVAGQTLREAARQRLFLFLLPLTLGLVALSLVFRQLHFGGSELRFLANFGFGLTALAGGLLALALPALGFFAELEQRTLAVVLARPVSRVEWLVGKMLGVAVFLFLFVGLLTVAIVGLVALRGGGQAAPSLLAYGALLWSKLTVVAALSLLVSTIASSALLAIGLAGLLYVAGHLQPVARVLWAGLEPEALRTVALLGTALLPNLQLFAVPEPLAVEAVFDAGAAARVVAYGTGWVAVATALAAIAFRRRPV